MYGWYSKVAQAEKGKKGGKRWGETLLCPALLRQEVIQLAADLQCLQLHESADRLVSNKNLGYGLLA